MNNNKIYKYIQETFSGLPIVYSGSYALSEQKMIDREVSDIDICFHKNYFQLILERVQKSGKSIVSKQDHYPDKDAIIVVDIDGEHLDIFFDRDYSFQKTIEMNGKTFLHGYEVLRKKLELLMNNSKQKHKHKLDIVNSMLPEGKKKANIVEKIKEEIPVQPTVEDLPF